MSLAVITVSGHLGRDAELRYTSGGQPILSFSVAASHYQGTGEQRTEHTDWYAVTLFGPRGEAIQRYLLKGTRVTVVGRLSHRHYTRQDGAPGCSLDVVANELDFSAPRGDAPDSAVASDRPPRAVSPQTTAGDDNIDDVPF